MLPAAGLCAARWLGWWRSRHVCLITIKNESSDGETLRGKKKKASRTQRLRVCCKASRLSRSLVLALLPHTRCLPSSPRARPSHVRESLCQPALIACTVSYFRLIFLTKFSKASLREKHIPGRGGPGPLPFLPRPPAPGPFVVVPPQGASVPIFPLRNAAASFLGQVRLGLCDPRGRSRSPGRPGSAPFTLFGSEEQPLL